jgi:hypothetical protein
LFHYYYYYIFNVQTTSVFLPGFIPSEIGTHGIQIYQIKHDIVVVQIYKFSNIYRLSNLSTSKVWISKFEKHPEHRAFENSNNPSCFVLFDCFLWLEVQSCLQILEFMSIW